MNELEFIWLMTWGFGIFAVLGILIMVIETIALKLFPHKFVNEDKISSQLDSLYSELAKGKEINIAEYIKENK
jgi:Na+-transporting methylmalonyl-CoA/oxaloacetate decarboxylase gamma subunit